MAYDIIINNGGTIDSVMGGSSHLMDAMLEVADLKLAAVNPELHQRIFEGREWGFINLELLTPDEFQTFYSLVKEGYRAFLEEGAMEDAAKKQPVLASYWHEFLRLMALDKRA
jgi:hypothetical protein